MVGRQLSLCLLAGFSLFALVGETNAQVLRKAGQALTRKMIGEGVEKTGQKSGRLIIRKSTAGLAESATQGGLKRVAGSSAARATSKSGQLIVRYGDDATKALAKLSPQNSRRLVMIAGDMPSTGEVSRLMKLIAKRGDGDAIMDFIWRNKATLVGGGLLATFVVNPDPFLSSAASVATEIVHTSGEHFVEPVVEHVAKPIVNWIGGLVLVGTFLCLGAFLCHRYGWPTNFSKKPTGSVSKQAGRGGPNDGE